MERENEALRERLTRMSQAVLQINESLEYDDVLDEVVDGARELTAARYGVITLLDESGEIQSFVTSGMTPEEHQAMFEMSEGPLFYKYLGALTEPLRLPDVRAYISELGLPEFRLPVRMPDTFPFLAAPIRRRNERLGTICLGPKENGGEFTSEDEETLVMFASQAAMVIANARRHREERRARMHLETLIRTSPVGVLVFSAKTGDLLSINREVERIVSSLHEPDQRADVLFGVSSVLRSDGSEFSLDNLSLAQVFRAEETVRAEEVVIRGPGGRKVSTIVNATPVRSDDGELDTFVVTLQDMTPLKEAERLRAEFLGMVSHELRAPLSTIKGSAETLLQESSDLHPAETRQFHRIILDQANHMRVLIRDLLDVALIETGTLAVSAEPTRLVGLVDQARSRFGGSSVLQIELPSDLPAVMVDRHRIVQVLSNLLSNADRHSPNGSVITVTAGPEGVHVALSVTDSGVGSPADLMPNLFKKFTGLGGHHGSGLGLAICKGIVEAHGGRIWAESEGPGRGSRFTFTLPVVEEAGLSPSFSGGGKKVLAVDDDPHSLRYVRDALTAAGYVPVLTGDPTEIPRLMEQEQPDLVLLDLMLPGTDGLELMDGVFRAAGVPVIFLSLYGQDEVIARALALGAVDYIVKPFSQTELAARIETALLRKKLPRDHAFGELTISPARREVTVGGQPVHLTGIEFRMLSALSADAGRVLTYEHLLREVWGPDNNGDLRPMRTVVRTLRQKLGDDAGNPKYIFTEPRVGYLMALGERA